MTSTIAGSSSIMMIFAIVRRAENISELRKGKQKRELLVSSLGHLAIHHDPRNRPVEATIISSTAPSSRPENGTAIKSATQPGRSRPSRCPCPSAAAALTVTISRISSRAQRSARVSRKLSHLSERDSDRRLLARLSVPRQMLKPSVAQLLTAQTARARNRRDCAGNARRGNAAPSAAVRNRPASVRSDARPSSARRAVLRAA